ncbi:haloacid dehalogenase-like hydrolase [Clavulina sp. PMI_390]|nr:haloacid dehalogenase-like hydrolase [Clavulina sp. PMI_390]
MFAPLNPARRTTAATLQRLPQLRGIVFDMDGTLCEPQTWMFRRMRDALGIDKSVDILDHIEALPLDRQAAAEEGVRKVEREAMLEMVAQPGLMELMQYLGSQGIKKAICTRNFDGPTQHLMNKFLNGVEISPIITRTFKPAKPHPAGILRISDEWGIPPHEMIMVGDSIDDMRAGRSAGATTVLLLANDGHNSHLIKHSCTDVTIKRLDELIALLEGGTLGA